MFYPLAVATRSSYTGMRAFNFVPSYGERIWCHYCAQLRCCLLLCNKWSGEFIKSSFVSFKVWFGRLWYLLQGSNDRWECIRKHLSALQWGQCWWLHQLTLMSNEWVSIGLFRFRYLNAWKRKMASIFYRINQHLGDHLLWYLTNVSVANILAECGRHEIKSVGV